jgi:hypothetical protein
MELEKRLAEAIEQAHNEFERAFETLEREHPTRSGANARTEKNIVDLFVKTTQYHTLLELATNTGLNEYENKKNANEERVKNVKNGLLDYMKAGREGVEQLSSRLRLIRDYGFRKR